MMNPHDPWVVNYTTKSGHWLFNIQREQGPWRFPLLSTVSGSWCGMLMIPITYNGIEKGTKTHACHYGEEQVSHVQQATNQYKECLQEWTVGCRWSHLHAFSWVYISCRSRVLTSWMQGCSRTTRALFCSITLARCHIVNAQNTPRHNIF